MLKARQTPNRKAGHSKLLLRTSPGQYSIQCRCGWSLQEVPRTQAKSEYAAHKASAKPLCSVCRAELTSENTAHHTHLCKSCSNAKVRAWADANRDAFEEARLRSHLKRLFHITLEEYDAMWKAQGECCAICRKPPEDSRGFRPHVDHCHSTGKVRGILCGLCNKGLGMFRDDLVVVQQAARYLEQHEGAPA